MEHPILLLIFIAGCLIIMLAGSVIGYLARNRAANNKRQLTKKERRAIVLAALRGRRDKD